MDKPANSLDQTNVQWGIVSACCAVLGLALHVLSEWSNAKTRAAIAELKTELVDRLNAQREHSDQKISALETGAAALATRQEFLEDDLKELHARQR